MGDLTDTLMIPDLHMNCASEQGLLEEALLGKRVKFFCTDIDINNNIVAISFGNSLALA